MSSGQCRIYVGESLQNITNYLGQKKNVVITDSNVRRCLGPRFPSSDIYEIEPGEENKTLKTVEKIYTKFLEWGLDRASFVVGIGGGVVCDMAGYAASTFLHGLPFGLVPTSLRGQIDACIGGKTGVNFQDRNNLIGTLNQPQFVLCDTDLLYTLSDKELRSGIVEIVKYAVIQSASFFEFLEQEWNSLLKLQKDSLEKAINDSIVIKSWILQSDIRLEGERNKLNFGHILGNVIQREGDLAYGDAVSIGIVLASKISEARGMLSREEVRHIITLLNNLKLPTNISSKKELLLNALRKDKRLHGQIEQFVLLSEIGKAEVVPLSCGELENHIHELC